MPPRANQLLLDTALEAAFLFEAFGSGCCFCRELVSEGEEVKQLAVPQLYPLGQHPATDPAFFPQRNQPLAHSSDAVAVGISFAGTTTVTPWEMIVEDGAGQESV
jgi:hypothetical protein